MSVVYFDLNRLPESLAAVQSAVKIDPQNIIARRQLCQLNVLLEKNEAAAACYKTLQKAVPLKAIE